MTQPFADAGQGAPLTRPVSGALLGVGRGFESSPECGEFSFRGDGRRNRFPMRVEFAIPILQGKGISIALAIRSLDSRLPNLCRSIVGRRGALSLSKSMEGSF